MQLFGFPCAFYSGLQHRVNLLGGVGLTAMVITAAMS
jgi:hypothetical protein